MQGMAESVTVRWGWQRVGELALAEGKLRFPQVPNCAGVYRFRLTSAAGALTGVYVGEGDPLPRRFQHYRTPGPSQQTNLRLNPILVSTLTAGRLLVCWSNAPLRWRPGWLGSLC
jgi:hypothetical protein